MDKNTNPPYKTPRKTCSEEKDQESAVLQELGLLKRNVESCLDLLHQLVLAQEDGEECLDDEESLSTSM